MEYRFPAFPKNGKSQSPEKERVHIYGRKTTTRTRTKFLTRFIESILKVSVYLPVFDKNIHDGTVLIEFSGRKQQNSNSRDRLVKEKAKNDLFLRFINNSQVIYVGKFFCRL